MTIRKVNLYSLGVFALFAACVLWGASARAGLDWALVAVLFFFIIIAWAAGIFLGLGLSVVVKRPAIEPYLYLTGQIAVGLALIVFWITTTQPERNHERATTNTGDSTENTRDNHILVDLDNGQSIPYRMDYIRTAFRKLESQSGDPNSFHLERFSSRWKDTVVNLAPDTIFSVLFTYLKRDRVLFAEVTVFGDSAVIKSMDSEIKPNPDEQFTKFGAWGRPIDTEEISRRLKDIPDSTRKRIIDNLSR